MSAMVARPTARTPAGGRVWRIASAPPGRVLADQSRRDRWQLSRDFRALFGTSPYRYLIFLLRSARCSIRRGAERSSGALSPP
jgi:hypothetical protein